MPRVLCVGLWLFALNVVCADEPDPRATHVILEITTPLQKQHLRGDVTAIVYIDGDALVEDSWINADRLDLDVIKSQLAPLGKREDSHVLLYLRTTDTKRVPPGSRVEALLQRALAGIGHDARFKKVRVGASFDRGAWDDKIDRAKKVAEGQPDQKEEPTTVGAFDVYPVRTFATAFLVGEADCVIVVKERIVDEDSEVVPKDEFPRLRAAIDALRLPRHSRVLIDTTSGGKGNAAVDRLVGRRQELQEALGFDEVSVRSQKFR